MPNQEKEKKVVRAKEKERVKEARERVMEEKERVKEKEKIVEQFLLNVQKLMKLKNNSRKHTKVIIFLILLIFYPHV